MIPIQISVIQVAVLLIAARYSKELVASVKASIVARTFTWVKAPYTRVSAWQGVVVLATVITLVMILPIVGNDGISATDGTIGTVIALLMIAAGSASLLNHTSRFPMIAAGTSGAFLAMALVTGSVSQTVTWSPAGILALIALVFVLLALRVAAPHEPETLHDANTVLFATLAAFFARLALPQLPITLVAGDSDTPPVAIGMAMVVIFGSIVAVALAIEILTTLWEKTKKPCSPGILVVLSFVLSVASVVASVWTIK